MFRNKKILLLLVCFVLGLWFIGNLVVKKRAKEREVLRLKEIKEKEELALEEPSKVPLSPAQILERETKIAGEDILRLIQPPEIKPKKITRLTKRSYKLLSVDQLRQKLKEALAKDDEGLLNQVLKGLEFKGEDTVSLLRKEILENFSQPQIRRNAVWGLFYLGKPEVIPILKTVIKVDPSEEVRLVALFALDSIAGKDVVSFMEEVSQNDPASSVRLKAQEYLRLRSISQ